MRENEAGKGSDVVVQQGESNKGGDVILISGKGGAPSRLSGSIVFKIPAPDGTEVEVLRFDPDGAVFVRGSLVDSNEEVYAQFKAWLASTKVER